MAERSLSDLAVLLRDFSSERDWEQFHSPKNLSMALAIETAEIMEHFQWLTEEQSNSLSPEKLEAVREEIGDVLIYLVRLADRVGIDPLQAAFDKVELNRVKYPVNKVRGSSKKYTEF